jgi:hypothetical protein
VKFKNKDMTSVAVYRVVEDERQYQEEQKSKSESHVVEDFPLGSALTAIRKLLKDAEEDWYHSTKPHENSMDSIRKIAAICIQMGELNGMPKRKR